MTKYRKKREKKKNDEVTKMNITTEDRFCRKRKKKMPYTTEQS